MLGESGHINCQAPHIQRRDSVRSWTFDEITSASVLLCETLVCFLQDETTGANVRLPKMQNISPDGDLELAKSPTKSGS